jgi:hypothetical protein
MSWFSRKPKEEPEPVFKTPVLNLCDILYPTPCTNPAEPSPVAGWKLCTDHKKERGL